MLILRSSARGFFFEPIGLRHYCWELSELKAPAKWSVRALISIMMNNDYFNVCALV